MRFRLLLALILVVVALAYANHFQNGFHFDDFHSIVNNTAIRDLSHWPRLLTDPAALTVLATNRVWRPVLALSLAIDYHLAGGLKPAWFHISTFAWYLLQLVLMALLFRRLLEKVDAGPAASWTALFATAWYGLHPAMAETVNYICQRADVYSALAVVAGLWLYIVKPGLRRYGLYLIPVILGMMAKPPAFIFAPLLLAYVWLFESKSPAQSLRASLPSWITCALLMAVQARMVPKTFTPSIVPAGEYILTQPYVAWRYFRTLFFPFWLSADTDLRPFPALNELAVFGIAFVLALVWIIWSCCRIPARKPIAFGLIWFVLGLIPTAIFPLSEVENDHRMFLPFPGLVLAVAWTVALLLRKRWKPNLRIPVIAAAAGLLLAYAGGTWARNQVWRTEESLWRDVTEKSPANGRGLMNYGVALMAQGRTAEAATYFERALEFTPNYSLLHINLGVSYGALNRNAEAERHFVRALELAPRDPISYSYYGRWLSSQPGRRADAIRILQTGLTYDGDHGGTETLLATLQQQEAQIPAPSPAMEPRTPEDWLNQSLMYHRAGRYRDSIQAAQRALALRPKYAEAYNNISAAYEELKDWDRAIEAAQKAIALQPDFQLARNNLEYSKKQKALAAH